MAIRINDEAPNFTADTTEGKITFHDWIVSGGNRLSLLGDCLAAARERTPAPASQRNAKTHAAQAESLAPADTCQGLHGDHGGSARRARHVRRRLGGCAAERRPVTLAIRRWPQTSLAHRWPRVRPSALQLLA